MKRSLVPTVLVLLSSSMLPARGPIPDPFPGPITDPGPIDPGVYLHQLPIVDHVMEGVMEGLAQREINVALVGGEGLLINDCLGIKVSAGRFILRWDRPTFQVDAQGIEISFGVEQALVEAFRIQFRILTPKWDDPLDCGWGASFGEGASASDVRFTFRFRPRVRLDDCQMVSLGDFDARLSIGGLNIYNVQNDLDRLAKNIIEDLATAFLDQTLPDMVREALSGSLLARICQGKYLLYQLYMAWLGAGVQMHQLPEEYIEKLQPLYPTRDLRTVRFGYSGRQEPGNATTDCNRMYFSEPGFVNRLRTATVTMDDDIHWSWLLHELEHTEQCAELGGRQQYAERWFRDLSIAVLATNLHSAGYFRVLHDSMPLEQDAFEREKTATVLTGAVSEDLQPVAGAEVALYPAGTQVDASTAPLARAVSCPPGLAHASQGDYLLFLAPGTYDVYVSPAGGSPGAPLLARKDLVVDAVDENDDVTCDVVIQDLAIPDPIQAETFIRGDSNDDEKVNISDVSYTLSWLFLGGDRPPCEKAADVDDSGRVNLTDALAFLGFLFLGEQRPPQPFPGQGPDPTADDLGCRLPDGPMP